jgi:hypothetical protein
MGTAAHDRVFRTGPHEPLLVVSVAAPCEPTGERSADGDVTDGDADDDPDPATPVD